MFRKEKKIKFGQVWKAIKNYEITEWWSPQKGCSIPKGTRIVILNDPVQSATHLDIMLLNSKGLDEKLSPNLAKMEKEKEGFGVTVELKKFSDCFRLDDNQEITFDNSDAAEFWKTILEHTFSKAARDAVLRTKNSEVK